MGKEVIVISEITEAIKNLQFGSIVITIHDGEVTQIDTTKKKRFTSVKKQKVR